MSKSEEYKTQANHAIEELRMIIESLIALPEEAEMEDKIEETLEDLEKLRAKVEGHSKAFNKKG